MTATAHQSTSLAEPSMPARTRAGAAIASVGVSLPRTVVSNAQIAARIGVDDGWIERRTGIRERRVAEPEERLATHATQAAEQALRAAGVRAADLDLVLVATTTADEVMPNAAPLVAHCARRGARGRVRRRRGLHRVPVSAGGRLRADRGRAGPGSCLSSEPTSCRGSPIRRTARPLRCSPTARALRCWARSPIPGGSAQSCSAPTARAPTTSSSSVPRR